MITLQLGTAYACVLVCAGGSPCCQAGDAADNIVQGTWNEEGDEWWPERDTAAAVPAAVAAVDMGCVDSFAECCCKGLCLHSEWTAWAVRARKAT